MESAQVKTIHKGKTFRKPCFIRTQKSHNVNVKKQV